MSLQRWVFLTEDKRRSVGCRCMLLSGVTYSSFLLSMAIVDFHRIVAADRLCCDVPEVLMYQVG